MPSNYEEIRNDDKRKEELLNNALTLLGKMYSDRTHFIFELLQNAEDAGAAKILFELFEDRLEVKHDGRPFDERDVRGVCGVGEGTKAEDLTQIGKFGIGFKSVYAYTSAPEVYSGVEHFRIERYVRPYKAATKVPGDAWTTLFVFVFDAPGLEPQTAMYEIAGRLRNLSARTLLFLRNIKEIEYKLPDETGGVCLREAVARGQARQITIIGQNNGQDEDENWLIFDRPLSVPDPHKPDRAKTVWVEIGFKLGTNTKDQTERIVRIKESPLVVYFPTEKSTRFGFLIQGPYKTTPSRDNIPKGDDWNTKLVKETTLLLVDALQHLKKMRLLTVALLNVLPIRMDDFPENGMFYPIVKAVRNTLMDQELLPANEGTFVSARNAKLASAEWLRTLLQEEQLKQLFKTENPLKWISGEITERKYDLWKYIREELKVEEVTPDSFARKIEGSLLEKQTDDWMNSFYTQLAGQKALWKKGSNSWYDKAGPLRAKEIIRLQDGFHVRPFKDDGSPNAFLAVEAGTDTSRPIVKIALSQNKDSLHFLRELGIPELDVVEEVIEILGKYSSPVTIDEHQRDIKKILKAYKTDSQEKKRRLIERLQATPFIFTKTPGIETTSFRRPIDAYFWSDELGAYFSGSKTVGFVRSDYYDQSALVLFKDLGVTDEIRIRCKPKNGSAEYVKLEYKNGYRRGLKGFDPDIHVDGLEDAIRNPSTEGKEIIWNKIAIKYSHCIKGKVLRSSRQDFSPNASTYKEDEITTNFGHLLIDKTWLPSPDGSFVRPSKLSLDDLPDSFIRDEKLVGLLEMEKDVVAKLAEEAGISQDTIKIAKELENHPELLEEFRKKIQPVASDKESTETETGHDKIVYSDELVKFFNRPGEIEVQVQITDNGKVRNPDRRREKSYEGHKERLHSEPRPNERRKETIRTILEGPDEQVREYLSQLYGGKCQICGKTFPERDGNPFFIANYIVPKKLARFADVPANALCLCADHFAKWQHGTVEAENISGQINAFKTEAEGKGSPSILRIKLCGEECKIKFKEKHLLDLQELLRASERHE